ncbi:MAG: YgfZ/GcvT domain-containing protein [Nocardioides sp.]
MPESPLLGLGGAVEAAGIDAGVAAHYGSFNAEQRTLVAGNGFVDLSHRDVLRIGGADRLGWLHSLTTQHLTDLRPGVPTTALILSPHGHVEYAFAGVDDGEALTVHTEPGAGAALAEYLDSMRFTMRVEVVPVTDQAVVWRLKGYDFVARDQLTAYAAAAGPPCGLWAFEALRIARGEPRLGLDTDHRTIPNEAGWIGSADGTEHGPDHAAVHLDKGCYRGQETVARVHTLGRPPRRLTMLHLDGTANALPPVGADLLLADRAVGFAGSSARHYELGPIALALVKRNVPVDAVLDVAGIAASQEVIVDPEVGLHVRPRV